MLRRYAFLFLLVTIAAGSTAASAVATVPAGVTPPDLVGTVYATPVARLLDLGIVTGYPDGTFRPARSITRAEMAAVAVRATSHTPGAQAWHAATTAFRDVPATHWAAC